MKKIIATLGIFLLVGVFSMTAFAVGNQNKDQSRITNRIAALQERQQKITAQKVEKEAKRQQIKTKQEEYTAFRKALGEKRDQMSANQIDNITLKQQNNQLRIDLANSIKAIKDRDKKLSDATLTKIKAYHAQIKDITSGIKETKGDIKDILIKNKGFIKAKDYTSMNTAFEGIYKIQQLTNADIKQINGILQEMVKLLANEV